MPAVIADLTAQDQRLLCFHLANGFPRITRLHRIGTQVHQSRRTCRPKWVGRDEFREFAKIMSFREGRACLLKDSFNVLFDTLLSVKTAGVIIWRLANADFSPQNGVISFRLFHPFDC